MSIDLARVPPSCEPLDMLFLFDRTASMNNVIAKVRDSSLAIMGEIARLSTFCRFGVAAFTDYDFGREVWGVQQDLTADTAAIRAALDRVQVVRSGRDTPEAYSRALYEAQFLGWRREARRFLVLFGDAPAHDPSFFGANLGIDRGRDALAGTADDLRFADVIGQLRQAGIVCIVIHDDPQGGRGKPYIGEAIRGFRYAAAQTGGVAKPVRSVQDIPGAIRSALRESLRPKPVFMVPASYSAWVRHDLSGWKGAGQGLSAKIRVQAPAGTPWGRYRFPLIATHGSCLQAGPGDEIGRTIVTIKLGPLHFPWRHLLLPLLLATIVVLALLLRKAQAGASIGLHWESPPVGRVVPWLALIAVAVGGSLAIWAWAPGKEEPPDPRLFTAPAGDLVPIAPSPGRVTS